MTRDVNISCTGIVGADPAQSDLIIMTLRDACIEDPRKVCDIAEFLNWVEEAVGDINGGKDPFESMAFASLSNVVDKWEAAP